MKAAALYGFPLYQADLRTILALANGSNSAANKSSLNAKSLFLLRAGAGGGAAQTSASVLVTTGIAADDPRVGNGGAGPGLLLEEPRTQEFPAGVTDLTGWSVGNNVVAAPTDLGTLSVGPNGSTNSRRYSIPAVAGANAISVFFAGVAGTNAKWSTSMWLQANAGTPSIYFMTVKSGGTNFTKVLAALTGSWKRFALTQSFTAGSNWFAQVGADLRDGTQSAIAAAVVNAAAAQMELGPFPTEFIASGTRNGERLYHGAPAQLLSAGRLGLWLRLIPKCSIGGANDNLTDPYAWNIDAGNNAILNKTTGAASVTIGGATFTTPGGFTWTNPTVDVIDLWIEAGGGRLQTVVKARKNDTGPATTLGVSGAPQSSIVTPATLDLLCNGTAGQLSSWVQEITTYPAGTRPSWAA